MEAFHFIDTDPSQVEEAQKLCSSTASNAQQEGFAIDIPDPLKNFSNPLSKITDPLKDQWNKIKSMKFKWYHAVIIIVIIILIFMMMKRR